MPYENTDIVFVGAGGTLHIFRYGYRFKPAGERDPKSQAGRAGTPDTHMRNWLDCIRSRKEPNATVEQGHYRRDGVPHRQPRLGRPHTGPLAARLGLVDARLSFAATIGLDP